MHSSAKTFLTALIAVAGAATMALVLADQTTPRNLHTVVLPVPPQASVVPLRLGQLDCETAAAC